MADGAVWCYPVSAGNLETQVGTRVLPHTGVLCLLRQDRFARAVSPRKYMESIDRSFLEITDLENFASRSARLGRASRAVRRASQSRQDSGSAGRPCRSPPARRDQHRCRRASAAGPGAPGFRDPSVLVDGWQQHSAFCLVARDIRGAGLSLRIEGVELLLETRFRTLGPDDCKAYGPWLGRKHRH